MVEVLSGREAGSLKGKNSSSGNSADPMTSTSSPKTKARGGPRAESTASIPSIGRNTKKKWTRAVRAIVLLEHIGTPDAVAILKDMATGHPDAYPTKVARNP